MEKLQVYKCPICGNIVEVLHVGGGKLVCCGKPMELMIEGTSDGALEKHVPVVEKQGNGYLVKVGAVPHPMTEEHYIEWIVVETKNQTYFQKLQSNQKPEATFMTQEPVVYAYAYCNLHSLWKKEM